MNTLELKKAIAEKASGLNLITECVADGTIQAQVAIVGEAPGEHECKQKLPFVGTSGNLLWQHLRKIDMTRMQIYMTNVVKKQVSFQTKKQAIPRNELYQWRELLMWELDQLPNIRTVIALGNLALQALTGHDGITQWRGSVVPITLRSGRTVNVVCCFNPAAVVRDPALEVTFAFDIGKIKRVLNGSYRIPSISVLVNPTFAEARDYIRKLQRDAVVNGLPVAYDIETISGETACVGFANSPTEAICINWRTFDQNRYSVQDERELRKEIQKLVWNPNVKLIAQNGMFDMTWLWFKDRIRVRRNYLDTMLAHHTLYPTLPHNLGFITTQYTDHPYYKDEKDTWREGGNINDFWTYNGKDCCITYAAALAMHNELRAQGLDKFFFDHVMRLQPTLARMTVGGVKMDMSLKDKIRTELADEVGKKLAKFHEAVKSATGLDEYEPNPKSHIQMGDLLFSKLKLVGRGTSTNAENRDRMMRHPATGPKAKEVLIALESYAEDSKFLSTYAEMEVDEDGRARCEYKQTGVQSAPGRLSSSKVMWGSGMNLQNQPARAYPMFVADDDYTFVYFDMAQAEARLVAYFAKIALWIEQFERARIDGSYDAHRALASEMFGIPYDEVPTADRDDMGHVTLRFVAKRCRHGLNYRMQPARLATTTGLSLADAMRAYNLYHRATPELRVWWDALEKEVRSTRTLFNAYGRRLLFFGRLEPDTLESIVAFKPQSTLGDHVTRVMYECESDDRWPMDARMVLNVHDALIALCRKDHAKRCLSIMKAYAERPIIIGGEKLIIPADCAIGQPDDLGMVRWSTIKKIKDIEAVSIN